MYKRDWDLGSVHPVTLSWPHLFPSSNPTVQSAWQGYTNYHFGNRFSGLRSKRSADLGARTTEAVLYCTVNHSVNWCLMVSNYWPNTKPLTVIIEPTQSISHFRGKVFRNRRMIVFLRFPSTIILTTVLFLSTVWKRSQIMEQISK